ncbi:heptaprenyl diphosphate synthase [Suicoccus acidiformans]|uniref:Heptaprenyl diphosphate synthase n=1 Tax=Suicoccus acidiformans TaxID=2036206 RepID=A0A347WLP4_9LACT|nr:Gx transporter family protein [Suicoccus acidiformans]AXY26001.1 heptaprenyl diphosphate synthase [Suicoccus acidiformans]
MGSNYQRNRTLVYIGLLAAQGIIISLIENLIPSPLAFAPGAKLGFANLITIIALFTLPVKYSFTVLMIRIIITALLGGTFSTFLYSLLGGILSYLAMLLVMQLGPKRVSIIGISVIGGVFHNMGQLLMASLMAKSFSVMNYLPVMSISGIIAGFAVGVLGNYLLHNIATLRMYHESYSLSRKQNNWLNHDDDKKTDA